MPKIKNKYTGNILTVTQDQLEILKKSNFPFKIVEPDKPKKPAVLEVKDVKTDFNDNTSIE